MTRRLGGIGRKSLSAAASLSLAAALACGGAMIGCGGDNGNGPVGTSDAGPDAVVTPDANPPVDSAKPDTAQLAACATPALLPMGGAVPAGSSVTLTSANLPAGGFIFYTTDGTLPSHASPALASGGSITITQAETIHAIASAATCSDSSVATAMYTVIVVAPDAGDAAPTVLPCPTPTFNPIAGSIPAGSNVAIAATGLPAGGFIYYTTDGTNPTHGSQVYSSPLQVNTGEQIRAISSASTCSDSVVGSATYTVQLPDGGLPLPVFTPPAKTENNDFLLALSEATSGTLICYTLDGVTTPTCSTTATAAVCTGTSQAYNAATRINLTGAVTGGGAAGVGGVTVQAIACGVGYQTTMVASQTYTLQVAQPAMVNPRPGNVLYTHTAGGAPIWPSPTLATNTTGASIQYTSDGTSVPTCGVASPGTNTVSPSAPITITTNTTFAAIGCKTGYAPSGLPEGLAYTIQLNPPVLPASTAPSYSNLAITPDDTANTGSGDWVCTTIDGTAPACGATASSCTGTGVTTGITVVTNNTTVKSIACKLGLTASMVAVGGPYVLQLSPPGLTQPGFDGTTGLPVTSYRIPVSGLATPIVGQSQPITTPATPAVVAYGFTCVMLNGGPACGLNMCASGTQVAVGGAIPALPVATDAWTVIGCPSATGPSAAFAASAPTTVTYSAATGALAPSITPASAGPFTTQLSPPATGVVPVGPATMIANTDASAVTICYSTDGTTTPACSNAACSAGTQVLAVAGAGSATLSFTITNGGTGYSTGTPPVVTVTGGGGSCTGLTATVVAGAVTAVSGTCTGYTSAPTVSFAGGGGTGAAATAVASDTVIVPALQVNNTMVQAVACSATLTQGVATPRTFNFQLAQPDFTAVATGDLNGGGSVGAGSTITLSTTSNFTGATIHYLTGGPTVATATCATGTSVTSGTNITVPLSSPFSLSAIACGTNQAPSAARSASFTVPAATPIITNNVTGAPTGSLNWQNPFTATISTVTGAGTQLCYTTDGTIPTCIGGVCGGSGSTIPVASPATVSINATGVRLRAVACTGTLAQSGLASADETLTISNVVVTQPATCPSAATIGLDPATTSGGPTANAIVCFTTDGTPAPANPTCILTPTIATGSNGACFSTTGGGATAALGSLSTTTALSVNTCKTGFLPAATVPSTVPFTPYVNTISSIDGLLQAGEWPAANQFAGTGGITGFVSKDATNLYLAVTGYTVAANTDVVIYVGADNTGGSTAAPGALGAAAIPFSARWAFGWASNDSQAGVTAYSASGATWSNATLAGVTVGFNSGNTVEFAIPLADFPGLVSTLDVSGAIVTGVGTAGVATAATWPSGGTNHFVADTLSACLTPVQQLQ